MPDVVSWTSLPNLHPALVHFPLALLPMAILFDVLGLVEQTLLPMGHQLRNASDPRRDDG